MPWHVAGWQDCPSTLTSPEGAVAYRQGLTGQAGQGYETLACLRQTQLCGRDVIRGFARARAMLEQFRAAVSALFGADPQAQQEANVWLQSFAATPAAWDAGLAMLEPGLPSNLLFFAANLLLNKTRTDWAKLPQEHRVQLTTAVG